MTFVPEYKKKYFEQVVPALTKQKNYTNVMEVPRLQKIILNQGLGLQWRIKKL